MNTGYQEVDWQAFWTSRSWTLKICPWAERAAPSPWAKQSRHSFPEPGTPLNVFQAQDASHRPTVVSRGLGAARTLGCLSACVRWRLFFTVPEEVTSLSPISQMRKLRHRGLHVLISHKESGGGKA